MVLLINIAASTQTVDKSVLSSVAAKQRSSIVSYFARKRFLAGWMRSRRLYGVFLELFE